MSAQGVPHHLGVLSHFKSVLWYLGDNRLTQDPEDALTQIGSQQYPDASVAERQQYLTLSVRDYLNERGKVLHAGETAGYFGFLGSTIGGIYYGLDGAPEADCVVTQDIRSDCLLLADDFYQYYLGAYSRSTAPNPASFTGVGDLAGADGTFGGPAAVANPLDEPGTFVPTSAVLPTEQFPQFASEAAGGYEGAAGGAFDPVEGSWYVGGIHVNDAHMRLARTVDLTGVTATETPTLRAQLSFDTEPGYDHVIVEAHPVGSDAWTTLPEAGGLTSAVVPAECEVGFLLEDHPFLEHYLTLGDTACAATGTTGAWNSMTGNSGGWQEVNFDLSAYAGQQVEVSISYITDPSTGGIGVVVDDTALVVGWRGDGERGLRDRPRRVVGARPAARQSDRRRRLHPFPGATLRRRDHRGLGAAGLRAGAGGVSHRTGHHRADGDAASAGRRCLTRQDNNPLTPVSVPSEVSLLRTRGERDDRDLHL